MKVNIKLFFFFLIVVNSISCNNQNSENKETNTEDKAINSETKVSEKKHLRKLTNDEFRFIQQVYDYYFTGTSIYGTENIAIHEGGVNDEEYIHIDSLLIDDFGKIYSNAYDTFSLHNGFAIIERDYLDKGYGKATFYGNAGSAGGCNFLVDKWQGGWMCTKEYHYNQRGTNSEGVGREIYVGDKCIYSNKFDAY